MADHPFANAGLGNFGMEKAYSQKGMQGGDGLLGKLAGALLDASGFKDFLDNSLGNESKTTKPVGSIAPANQMSQQGINPMILPNAVPGGIGLNAKPAANPFQFPTTPAPQLTPDEEYRNQIKNAWR